MCKKHVCNVYIFQLSFHFAYHRWWLGRKLFFGGDSLTLRWSPLDFFSVHGRGGEGRMTELKRRATHGGDLHVDFAWNRVLETTLLEAKLGRKKKVRGLATKQPARHIHHHLFFFFPLLLLVFCATLYLRKRLMRVFQPKLCTTSFRCRCQKRRRQSPTKTNQPSIKQVEEKPHFLMLCWFLLLWKTIISRCLQNKPNQYWYY